MHSMALRERALALEVIGTAWEHLAPAANVLATVRAEAAALPERYPDVSPEFAQHIGAAAVWYLDRATRRIGDPDRDGLTAGQQAVNLGYSPRRRIPRTWNACLRWPRHSTLKTFNYGSNTRNAYHRRAGP